MPGPNGASRMTASTRCSTVVESGALENISPIAFLCLRCSGVEAPLCASSVLTMMTPASRGAETSSSSEDEYDDNEAADVEKYG